MTAKKLIILLLVVSLLISGCGSMFGRYYTHDSKVYIGVRMDFCLPFLYLEKSSNPDFLFPLVVLAAIVDLPLSFTLDTLCLPCDYLFTGNQNNSQNSEGRGLGK